MPGKNANKHGEAVFTNIPVKYRNQWVTLELVAPGWQFMTGSKIKTRRDILLKEKVALLEIQRDGSLAGLRFSVTGRDRQAVPQVAVFVEGRRLGDTDENGWVTVKLPADLQKPEVSVTLQKPGYKVWESRGYPAAGTVIEVVLEKGTGKEKEKK